MKKVGALALFVLCVLVTAASAQAADISQDEPGHVEKCEVGRTDYSSDMAKVTRYPDGGSTYTFSYGDEGNTETIGQPPQGFDPLKASDEEVARYSFPPRPGDAEGKDVTQQSLSDWEGLVSGFKEAGPPITCEGPVDPGSTNSEPVQNSPLYNQHWAGHMVHSNEGERSVATFGHFYEPSGNAYASCKSTALVSNWLGLGGWNGSGKLLQSGTGTATNNQHTIWWQGYWEEGNGKRGGLEPQYFMEKVPFEANSYMGFYTGYNLAEYKAYFYLSNESTGVTWPIATGLAPKYYDGSSAESITERPGNGKKEPEFGYYPLLNFNHETFWNIKWQNSYNEVRNIGEASFYTWHADIKMTNNGTLGGLLLAEPSGLSLYQNYDMWYDHCQ